MKKIKITVGTYGYRKDNTSPVVLIDKKSAPIEVKDSEAERVVNLGIAEYVGNVECGDEKCEDEGAGQSQESELEECSLRDLQKIAKEMGLKANGSREELIEKIKEAAEEELGEDPAEAPPVLDAVDPE